MPTERLAMRHVRDVMRLKSAGMPSREIARRVGAAPSTVRLTIRRFEAAGLTWPLPDDVTDTVLEARLFAKAGSGSRQGQRRLAEPDWAAVHRELKRKHVTLSIVWEEYIAGEPGGYRYSRFCELYRAWEGRLSVTMRQSHAAGDKLFVDYAGDGVPVVIDRLTGERRSAQIFVAVLGASSFTYAQATWTQGLADWISGHVGAFEPRATHRRSRRPYKTRVRMPSKLDPHIAAIEGWLAEQPQLTALAIVGRLSEKYPEEFGTGQHSIVQRLLRALSRKAAEQLVAQEPLGDVTTAAPLPGVVDGSGYAGPDPPTAPLVERAGKATWRGRSIDIGSSSAMAPSG